MTSFIPRMRGTIPSPVIRMASNTVSEPTTIDPEQAAVLGDYRPGGAWLAATAGKPADVVRQLGTTVGIVQGPWYPTDQYAKHLNSKNPRQLRILGYIGPTGDGATAAIYASKAPYVPVRRPGAANNLLTLQGS